MSRLAETFGAADDCCSLTYLVSYSHDVLNKQDIVVVLDLLHCRDLLLSQSSYSKKKYYTGISAQIAVTT